VQQLPRERNGNRTPGLERVAIERIERGEQRGQVAPRPRQQVIGHLGRKLEAAARGDANLLPVLVETVKTYATIGEICDVLREVFGEYQAMQVY